ncbi:Ribosomal RNA small subunit methyltransferase G [Quillaja saponaria]|uniref:Ribosomal RNA small subunit methyltransferase G n=1 Tax=Quillaja saponaria TaxID=32244 RepID=A0AAD7LDU3_QUISA|nr:Ribosomal RNA small subunit methyltransferase G [Quillaja saponaria]
MLLSRSIICNVQFSCGTYFKHLPTWKPSPFSPYRTTTQTFPTSTVFNTLSHFETLTSRQKDQIHLYVDALLQWNKRMNLTAVTEMNEVMERHVEDSLAILPPLRDRYRTHCKSLFDNVNLVDVGTGAGIPGMILAIACPDWDVTLLESRNKRCVFLEHAINVTGLSNAKVVRGRAEDLGQNPSFREQFDIAVARAVAEMRILAEYCLPLVRVGGLFVAAKGHDPEVEVRNAERAIQLMGASVLQVCPVESHSPYGQRTVIICWKDLATPRKYPRDPGTPAKEPL